MDTGHGFIIGGHATAANRADYKEFTNVIRNAKPSKGSPVLADKGYSSEANRNDLKSRYFDLIMYKAALGRPLSEAQVKVNKAISRCARLRGESLWQHEKALRPGTGQTPCLCKMNMQLMLSAMAFNLKKAALLTKAR